MRTIKVIHCIESWLPRTAVWLYEQIRFLPMSVDNYVVCQVRQNGVEYELPHVYSLAEWGRWRQYAQKIRQQLGMIHRLETHLGMLDWVIRRVEPDIVHSHFGHFGAMNARVAQKYGMRHVVSFYGADVGYIPRTEAMWGARYREMAGQVGEVWCEGPCMARHIVGLGVPPEKVRIQRLGIDLGRVEFRPRRRRRGEKLRFLIAATFREKKGIPYALEALGLFRRVHENIEITLIGDATHEVRDQIEKERVLKTIREWSLGGKVRLLGFVSREVLLREAYDHHVFVSPSVTAADGDTEGGAPVTIIEMAASGMPIVSTRHCDIPFVLSEENRSLLVDEADSVALCNAVKRLADGNWDELCLANRRFIEKEMDVRRQAQKMEESYMGLLNS